MLSANWMVAVTYLEWIRWIASGRLRCVGRLTYVRGLEDQTGFDALMDRAPDLNVEEDHGYVLAAFKQDDLQHLEPAKTGDGLGAVWMPIAAVTSFFPLSERAQRLLEADASRAGARLGEPVFDRLWQHWQARRRLELAGQRSKMLCTALNLPYPLAEKAVPDALHDVLMGVSPAPNADKAERLRGSSAYAWALSFSLFGEIAGEEAKKGFADRLNLRELLTNMERAYPTAKPVTMSPAIGASQHMTAHLKEHCKLDVSVSLIAVVLHYRHLLETGRSVSLESLLDDLSSLGVTEGLTIASLAAQTVATAMEDAAVTTLLYQSAPQGYAALRHERPAFELDVPARVKALLPKEPLPSVAASDQDKPLPEKDGLGEAAPDAEPDSQGDSATLPPAGALQDQRPPAAAAPMASSVDKASSHALSAQTPEDSPTTLPGTDQAAAPVAAELPNITVGDTAAATGTEATAAAAAPTADVKPKAGKNSAKKAKAAPADVQQDLGIDGGAA